MAFLPESLPAYAELHCLSNFSFLRGASSAEELVGRAARLGYAALAITDECSLAGIVRAHVAARQCGLKLIVGSEIRLEDGLKLVLLAPDRRAYGALSSLITTGRRRVKKGAYSLCRQDLDVASQSGLLALCLSGSEPDYFWAREKFPDRSWLAVELHHDANDSQKLNQLKETSRRTGLPLVAAGGAHMHVRSRRRLQDVLTAIRIGRPVAECGHALYPNSERHLRMRTTLERVYGAGLLKETLEIAERCTFSMDELRYEYPEELVPAGETPVSHLRKLVSKGMDERFPLGVPLQFRTMVDREFELIEELKYEAFFLTVHDMVCFARSKKILCQGRGSAANSAICYFLGITAVDPVKGNALFERFISRERGEPPDIDVDFEHERREEVIQYVYGKYGRDRTAIAATVICYKSRSAIRDLGKALGMSLDEVNRLSKSMAWWDDRSELSDRVLEAGLDPRDPRIELLLDLCGKLIGFPRHLSQHVGGFVISGKPLAELVPVENAAMEDRTVIQWDKEDLESLKLLKVDVLALGMLSALRRGMEFVGIEKLRDIPDEDPFVYKMIQQADTIGVFQIESRAQRSMLPRLKPANLYDLVIQVAIVRPGPIQGDMVHPYLRRRDGIEKIDYPSEAVRSVLERTLGVPIFQEQAMQLSMVAAGFSADEADQLRRAMASWKKRGGLEFFEAKLKNGMRERGYTQEFADRVYSQLKGFSEYGFPESHSASFAQLAYFSAWLKHHHPAAFLAALLNSQPMGFYSPSQLIQDARRHGVEVRPADVSLSQWECTLEEGVEGNTAGNTAGSTAGSTAGRPAVRLGLRMVKGLGKEAGARITAGRPHDSAAGLARRAELNAKELKALATAGALQSLAGHRRNARWASSGIEKHPPMDIPPVEGALDLPPPSEGEEIVADYASLGFTLGRHPLALLRKTLSAKNLLDAKTLNQRSHGSRARAAGLVTCRQHPDTKTGVVFVTLEDESGDVNVVVWNDIFRRYRRELLGASLLGVEGVVEREGGVVHLIARRLVDHSPLLAGLLGPLAVTSHDFH